jgi:hypothetical protein
MSDEQNVETNDGTWSGLKKTIIGTLSTAVLAGGTWVTTTLFNGGEDKEEVKTEQAAQPVINLNVDNSSQNNSSNNGGGTTVIRERVVEKPAAEKKEEKKKEKKSETEDAPW